MLPDDELKTLAADIAANGLIDPITTDDEGRVLDGRNRLEACAIAGVPPVFVTMTIADDAEAAAIIISRNATRRHMTSSQIAAARAKTLAIVGQRKNGRWTRGSAGSSKSCNSDRADQVAMAKSGVVLDHAPDLLDSVISGATSLDAAHTEAQRRKQAAESAEAKMAELVKNEPDLAQQVKAETLTLAEGLAAAAERARMRRITIDGGHRSASGFRLEVIGAVASVMGANSLGAQIDVAPLIQILEEALDALKNGDAQ